MAMWAILMLAAVLAAPTRGNICSMTMGHGDVTGTYISLLDRSSALGYRHYRAVLSDVDLDNRLVNDHLMVRIAPVAGGKGAHSDLGTLTSIAQRYSLTATTFGIFTSIHVNDKGRLVIQQGDGSTSRFQPMHDEDVAPLTRSDGQFIPQEGHVYLVNGTYEFGKWSRLTKLMTTAVTNRTVQLAWEVLLDGSDDANDHERDKPCLIGDEGDGWSYHGNLNVYKRGGSGTSPAVAYTALAFGLIALVLAIAVGAASARRQYEPLA